MDRQTVKERREAAKRRASAVADRPASATPRKLTFNARIAGLLFVLALAITALAVVHFMPRRTVKPDMAHYLSALEAPSIKALAPGEEPKVRGLIYMLPTGKPAMGSKAGTVRGQLRNAGLLRAYSEPPDRIVFSPDGLAHYLPIPPMPGSPRTPGSVYRGNKNQKKVALTFDDGYSGMGSLIDLLVDLRVPATIFPAGGACAADKAAIAKAAKYGFEIANHSWNHPTCTKVSNEGIARELTSSDSKVKEICGQGMVGYFRPPYGDSDERVVRVSGDLGYLVIMWSKDTLDWSPATTADQLVSRATDGVQNGDIILMHSHAKYTQVMLPTIVKKLRDKGFELTTISGVLAP